MNIWKHLFHLFIIYSLLFTISFLFNKLFGIGLPFTETITILTSAFIISLVSLWLFSRGIKKDDQRKIITALAALGVKLSLYLILLLVYYLLSKIQGVKFIITFFVIYLSFTYYLLKVFIQIMKQKQTNE